MIEIRPATPSDLLEFYGRIPPVTVRAIVAIRDGVIEAVAGITMEENVSIAFSDMKPNTASKRLRYETAKRMVEWMKPYHPGVTLEGAQKCSHKFLTKLGFIYRGDHYEIAMYRL